MSFFVKLSSSYIFYIIITSIKTPKTTSESLRKIGRDEGILLNSVLIIIMMRFASTQIFNLDRILDFF